MMNPRAKRDQIFTETLGSETILYDKNSHQAHSLNKTVALVWESANGERSIDDIAEVLQRELGLPSDRGVVLLALEELSAAGLLEVLQKEAAQEVPSRRQVARRLALAGASAALVPLVASVLAPTPAMASSPSLSKQQAGKDLISVGAEAWSKPGFWVGPHSGTAQADLVAANNAYKGGNYPTEVTDLNGVLGALGLPPL